VAGGLGKSYLCCMKALSEWYRLKPTTENIIKTIHKNERKVRNSTPPINE
jgi:hypothetical protein